NRRTTRVTGSVSDTAPVTVTVNGTPVATTGNAFSVDVALADGANTIAVSAIDAAGNASAADVHVSLDQAPPAVQIASPADGAYVGTATPSVRIAYQDNGSVDLASLRILIDGQDQTARFTVSAGEASTALDTLADGSHSVSASAT